MSFNRQYKLQRFQHCEVATQLPMLPTNHAGPLPGDFPGVEPERVWAGGTNLAPWETKGDP